MTRNNKRRKAGDPSTKPPSKIAKQRSAPPSPSVSSTSDSETLDTFSDSSSSTNHSLSSVTSKISASLTPKTVTTPTVQTPSKPSSTPRPPPIILNSTSWRKIAPVIYSLPNLQPSSLSAKSSGERVTLRTADATQFRMVQKALSKHGTEFHTFSLPEERSLKVVLKGIPNDISTDELQVELESLGYTVQHVRRFGTPEKPMPICAVHIAANHTAKDIFSIFNLFYLQISVEPLKPSGPAQCFSCQRFGHGSRNCGHPPRCVKCAGNHTANVCPKTFDQPPTCCNCGGSHTANFRGCPQCLAQKQQVAPPSTQYPASQQSVQPISTTPPPPPPAQNTTLTYSAATSKPVHTLSSSPLPQLNLASILNLLTNLLTALSNNQDPKTLIQTTIQTFLSILSPQNE